MLETIHRMMADGGAKWSSATFQAVLAILPVFVRSEYA